jgi:hypothetical protein
MMYLLRFIVRRFAVVPTLSCVSPEVANILEFTSGFRADVTGDADRGTVGTVKTGSLSKKWDVYVDPYFPRNVVLVVVKVALSLKVAMYTLHMYLSR